MFLCPSVPEHESGTVGRVVIKVDSGMSRNGCQPGDLSEIVEFCENNKIPVHSIMTHFAQSWDDPVFTKAQLDTFMEVAKPYRNRGIKIHAANSGAIVNQIGVDLDYVRPGISMYGQAPDTSELGVSATMRLGLLPAISWYALANKVTRLAKGRVVGYDQTYKCTHEETIAVIPIGYADGYLRSHSSACVRTLDGTLCPVVGRVSMDAITIRLPAEAISCREFCLMPSDFNENNSSVAFARYQNTIPYEVCTNLSRRMPRLYVEDGSVMSATNI
ncbi:alanine racemase-like [Dreissena polymorpha]|uniref:Alanine racemase C-terminal domain-containing protein n=1 Tax=Dreissena polymorpha TaxID=45954 RepID=A0A9D4LT29_DREPO|nr:alanine racemase-like [Dreissena polymorpha]KAH3863269.1 hypothetical protein DPMN_026249 [Dreissena polymorpha]